MSAIITPSLNRRAARRFCAANLLTNKELADRAGLSLGTVSRALRGRACVSPGGIAEVNLLQAFERKWFGRVPLRTLFDDLAGPFVGTPTYTRAEVRAVIKLLHASGD